MEERTRGTPTRSHRRKTTRKSPETGRVV
jgi:hypothetical protein